MKSKKESQKRIIHSVFLVPANQKKQRRDWFFFFHTTPPKKTPPITAEETCASIPRVDNVSAKRNDVKAPAVRRRWCKPRLQTPLACFGATVTHEDRQVLSDCSTPKRRVVTSTHLLFA